MNILLGKMSYKVKKIKKEYEEANMTNAVIHIYMCLYVLQENRGLTIRRNNMFYVFL